MAPIVVPRNASWPAYIADNLPTVLNAKFGPTGPTGWSPRLRQRFGYCTPDELYEAAVCALVNAETVWLDVGCGRDMFPSNLATAAMLAQRCRLLVGLDPSDNIEENTLLHERVRCTIEQYRPERQHDLITMRMVAEHIEAPEAAVAALSDMLRPGGRVVLYTVRKWSPAAVAAALTPMAVHHRVKRVLWDTAERDTFPTFYRMNTRDTLRRLFAACGCIEESFLRLDDTRSFAKWKSLATLELSLWRLLQRLGVAYPEACLMGIYRKASRG